MSKKWHNGRATGGLGGQEPSKDNRCRALLKGGSVDHVIKVRWKGKNRFNIDLFLKQKKENY